jgi:ribonuclease T2
VPVGRIAVAALALALPAAAQAQAYQCRVPDALSLPPPVRADGPAFRTRIGGYTLALSWSPEYCRSHGRDPANAVQCGGGAGRFGFIVHGLWPEAAKGRPPQWCATTPRPTLPSLRSNLCMTPSPGLLEHEWAKHGSCMASSPEGYYRVAATLWQSLRFPDMDRLSRDEALTAGTLRQELVTLNRGWRAEAIGLLANERGWLQEVRLCYDRKFMPSRCPRSLFGPADKAALKIWRGL